MVAPPYTFYFTVSDGWIQPYMLAEPVLLSAASFARRGLPTVTLPAFIPEVAVDCGAFVATFKQEGYQFTSEQYVDWLYRITPTPHWAAMMDLCCENEAASGRYGIVRERQQWTTDMALHFWRTYRTVPFCWCPTIQGWTVEDYGRHAAQMRPLVEEMRAHYQALYGDESAFRVGIGSLCRRANNQMIQQVVQAIAAVLPGVRFHLWGIKRKALVSPIALPPQVASSDSAAWNGRFGREIEQWRKSGKTERQYAWEDAATKYSSQIKRALRQPKQFSLFDRPPGC